MLQFHTRETHWQIISCQQQGISVQLQASLAALEIDRRSDLDGSCSINGWSQVESQFPLGRSRAAEMRREVPGYCCQGIIAVTEGAINQEETTDKGGGTE